MWVCGSPCWCLFAWLLCKALQPPACLAAVALQGCVGPEKTQVPWGLSWQEHLPGASNPVSSFPCWPPGAASWTVSHKVEEVGEGRIYAELWAPPKGGLRASGMKDRNEHHMFLCFYRV